LCAALGPAILTVALVVALVPLYRLLGAVPLRWPGVAELAVQPVRLLGAGLLGVLTARWFPGRVRPVLAACVVIAAMFAVDRYAAGGARRTLLVLFPFTDLSAGWLRAEWHLVYLLCLDVLAAVGALLATPGPRRTLLAAGAAAVTATVIAGWSQLP
jgi:hypothetical protein